MVFLFDDQGILIILCGGEFKCWQLGKGLLVLIVGVLQVWVNGQGGLLDVVLVLDFVQLWWVWLSYVESDVSGKVGIVVGYGWLSEDVMQLMNFIVVFCQQLKFFVGNYFGGRLVFDGKGYVFIGLGENNQCVIVQDFSKLQGKVVCLMEIGGVLLDNFFVGWVDVRLEIWVYGICNLQGMVMNFWSEVLWLNEYGLCGGDEINILQVGKNYGWLLVMYGINYSGLFILEVKGKMVLGIEFFLYVWLVFFGVSGMVFYLVLIFFQWQYKLFIGVLKEILLIVLVVDGNQVCEEGRLLEVCGKCICDVCVGFDGYLYVLIDEFNGELLWLSFEVQFQVIGICIILCQVGCWLIC